MTRSSFAAPITPPEQACQTKTTGPVVRSSAQFNAAASLLSDVSGIGAQITFSPRRSSGPMMLLQQDPSAPAACTKTIVELSGNSPDLVTFPVELAPTCASF